MLKNSAFIDTSLRICLKQAAFASQDSAESLGQQGFFQLGKGGEFALVEGFEALGLGFVHGVLPS